MPTPEDNTSNQGEGGKDGKLADATSKAGENAADAKALGAAKSTIRELEGKLADATSKAAGLAGELETVTTARDVATRRVTELTDELVGLRASVAESGQAPKLDLPPNAKQLKECATFADTTKKRRDAKLGDVVVVEKKADDAEKLQKKLGKNLRVYGVDQETFDDLIKLELTR